MRVGLAFLVCSLVVGGTALAERCGVSQAYRNRVQVGAALQVLMPNNLPAFGDSLVSYGVTGSVPLGPVAGHVQASYGTQKELTVALFEGGLRYFIGTPFVDFFVLGGFHYLRYGAQGASTSYFGPNAGLGMEIAAGESFILNVFAKGYLQDRAVVSFGGWFGVPIF